MPLRRFANRAPRRLRGVAHHALGCAFVLGCGAVGLPLGLLIAYGVGLLTRA